MRDPEARAVAAAFGAVLRAQRRRARLSQEALALEAGLDRTYVSLLERGQRQPTLGVLLRLGRALACPPAELLGATLARLPSEPARRDLPDETFGDFPR
jgi:transcriptional regulator with XRE-family HTH domain